MSSDSEYRPAVITVGNELTFGERRNGNQEWLCEQLFLRGHPAEVALSLPDDQSVISHWIRTLSADGLRPILVSGGIGGTHDDCTRQSIAAGLDVPLTRHKECYEILADRYAEKFTDQRKRMTELPDKCDLIENTIGAPGFSINGVYGFPGFPNMLRPMFEIVANQLFGKDSVPDWQTLEFAMAVAEGDIAMDIEKFDNDHDGVHLGIYPSTEKFRREVTVRLRYPKKLEEIAAQFESFMQKLALKNQVALLPGK